MSTSRSAPQPRHEPAPGGWRSPILRHFTPEIAAAGRLTVVLDEDELFTDPALLEAVSAAGFELLPATDPVALRYAYETRVRVRRDAGEPAPHAVVVCRKGRLEAAIPSDMLRIARREGRVLSFGATELFPRVAPAVVTELPREMLDALADALDFHGPSERLGEQSSRDFVLRHVYQVAPELVQRDSDLLRVLLRRHHVGEVWPPALDRRFVQSVRAGNRFTDWPLEQIVPGRDAFFAFVEERWPRYVRASAGIPQDESSDALISAPRDLPLGHDDVRVYLDTLFLEGRLARTRAVPASAVAGRWMAVGVQPDESSSDDAAERINRLGALLAGELPSPDASHLAWGNAARRYSEWLAMLRGASRALYDSQPDAPWRTTIETSFAAWMLKRYPGLASLPAYPRPVMVHQVPEVMARDLRDGSRRVALLVMDGMGGSQWAPLRESFVSSTGASARIDEDVVFAWVPTVTSVSRQALHAGELPLYFSQSLNSTQKDEARWRSFWERDGLTAGAVGHVGQRESENDDAFVERALEVAGRPGMRAVAITCTAVDRMVHGAVGGERGLQAAVSHWANEGHFRTILTGLLDAGYTVHVTADHGNVPARGIGRPKVGDVPDVRGERVLVFGYEALRSDTAAAIPGAVSWPSVGLPSDYLPLLAPAGGAFTTAGAEIIGHGGISIEEVVVPYVRFDRPGDQ